MIYFTHTHSASAVDQYIDAASWHPLGDVSTLRNTPSCVVLGVLVPRQTAFRLDARANQDAQENIPNQFNILKDTNTQRFGHPMCRLNSIVASSVHSTKREQRRTGVNSIGMRISECLGTGLPISNGPQFIVKRVVLKHCPNSAFTLESHITLIQHASTWSCFFPTRRPQFAIYYRKAQRQWPRGDRLYHQETASCDGCSIETRCLSRKGRVPPSACNKN